MGRLITWIRECSGTTSLLLSLWWAAASLYSPATWEPESSDEELDQTEYAQDPLTFPSRPLSQSTSEVTRLVPRPKGVAKSSSSAGQSRTVSSSPPAKSSLVTITRANPLNGNAAGSRKSERKRNQKGVSKSDDLAGINVKQLGDCSNFSCGSSTYWVLGLVVGILCSNFFLWACQLCMNRMELYLPRRKRRHKKNAGTGEQQKAEALKAKQSKPTFAEAVASKPSGFFPVWQLRSSDWDGAFFHLKVLLTP